MSRLETEVKPLLLAMIQNQANAHLSLSEPDQLAIARWAVKTSIMMQFTDMGSKTSHPDDDTAFYRAGQPLAMNSVWLGRYEGTEWDRRFIHANVDLADRRTRQTLDKWGSTTIAIDSLIVYVLWDPQGKLDPMFPYGPSLRRIWPVGEFPAWPPSETFTDTRIKELAEWAQWASRDALRPH